MTGGQLIVESLVRHGVEVVFGIPGAHTMSIYDALYRHPKIKHILVRHEQSAALMADGYAKTYKELVDTTDWSKYGRHSGNVQCRNCMAHCGYEPTAVMATTKSLKESIRALVNS